MSTLYVALTILLVFVSITIIALVLLQKGKGAEAGAAFGAGASGTVFGARGTTNFLSRATAILASVFFVNCLALAYLSAQRQPGSVLEENSVMAEPTLSEPQSGDAVPDDMELPASELPEVAPVEESSDSLPDLPAQDESNDEGA